MSTQPVVAHKPAAEDFMPLHGIDHVELWVGNAAQAAHFYREALGFEQVAYAGLETGLRDRVSYVLQQGRIRIVLTGALGHRARISEHHHRHGDGVKVIALSVPDTDHAYRTAVERGATGITEPHDATDDHGTVRLATIATYGDTVHTFVERSGYTGPFLPGYVEQRRPPRHGSTGLLAIDHIVGNVELGKMERWVKFYEDVFGMTKMIHFSDDDISTEYSALMSKVVTSGNGPHQVPDQRARRGQAQVADRRVPRVLRRRRRAAHRGGDARHRRHRGRAARARRRVPPDARGLLRRGPRARRRDRGGPGGPAPLGILVDRDDEGYLLQIFTKPVGDRPTCSSRSSSAMAPAASARATSRPCSRRSSASRSAGNL